MKKMTTADVQKCELNLLKVFVEICEKHHLRYYLAGCVHTMRAKMNHHRDLQTEVHRA